MVSVVDVKGMGVLVAGLTEMRGRLQLSNANVVMMNRTGTSDLRFTLIVEIIIRP